MYLGNIPAGAVKGSEAFISAISKKAVTKEKPLKAYALRGFLQSR